jgi:hypothetical protein
MKKNQIIHWTTLSWAWRSLSCDQWYICEITIILNNCWITCAHGVSAFNAGGPGPAIFDNAATWLCMTEEGPGYQLTHHFHIEMSQPSSRTAPSSEPPVYCSLCVRIQGLDSVDMGGSHVRLNLQGSWAALDVDTQCGHLVAGAGEGSSWLDLNELLICLLRSDVHGISCKRWKYAFSGH